MGIRFTALGKVERAAVAAFVRGEYDKLIFRQPNSYVSKNAQTDPEQWQDALRELIAGDPKRVEAIVEAANRTPPKSDGFTLIEMSIVLVIIGLIVGGVLVGQNLIAAAGVRATIAQIEKYNTAVNTFRGKYGALPGDIGDPGASSFGFIARGTSTGQGDGNGVIQGYSFGSARGLDEGMGEAVVFWRDLSMAGLIDDKFNTANFSSCPGSGTGSALNMYFPQAKLGEGNYFYVWSGGFSNNTHDSDGQNYFELAVISSVSGTYSINPAPGLTVAQSQGIDQKMDDGLPQSGNVMAVLASTDGVCGTGNPVFFVGGGANCWGASTGFRGGGGPTTAATPGSSITCYDNGNAAGATQQYSVEQSGGSNVNCALSFRFQ